MFKGHTPVEMLLNWWKSRGDDLWDHQQRELFSLEKERSAWQHVTLQTHKHVTQGELDAIGAAERSKDELERATWNGERRAYRRIQLNMETTGRSRGLELNQER